MSDLVDRLRKADEDSFVETLHGEAADRIESLEAENRELAMQVLASDGQAADAHQAQLAAEAKLAKAVKAGMHIAVTAPIGELQSEFNKVLAELKGGE